jgi:hypothetical protein
VADEYGCGAHSETPAPPGIGSPAFDPFDDGVIEVTDVVAAAPVEDVVEEVVDSAADDVEVESVEPVEATEPTD